MPGKSFSGTLPPLGEDQRQTESALRRHVEQLAEKIGERNTRHPLELEKAAQYIESEMKALGYAGERGTFAADGQQVANLIFEVPGASKPKEIVIVGAHYDSVIGTPGANDNGSGVAALLELAREARGKRFGRTVRYVFFVNEEPPFFQGEEMGSVVYAKHCRKQNDDIVAMYSLETIGYYSNKPNSQHYPSGLGSAYPDRGNFISFVANESSSALLRESIATFRNSTKFPSVGAAVPESLPGAGWSDHWSFWREGYPGIMLTDTAPFRYAHYHLATDTPEKIDYDAMTRVVSGISRILEVVAKSQ